MLSLLKQRKILLLVLLLLILPLLVFVVVSQVERLRLEGLASPLVGEETVSNANFRPSFPSTFESLNGLGVVVFSTGRISQVELKSARTGEKIAEADVLETASRSIDGRARKLNFALQVRSLTLERNLNPWVVEKASELRSLQEPDGAFLDVDKLRLLFPEGSKWILIPLLDPSSEGLTESIVEYASVAENYYGDRYASLQELFTSGLKTSWEKPIILLDVFYYFRD